MKATSFSRKFVRSYSKWNGNDGNRNKKYRNGYQIPIIVPVRTECGETVNQLKLLNSKAETNAAQTDDILKVLEDEVKFSRSEGNRFGKWVTIGAGLASFGSIGINHRYRLNDKSEAKSEKKIDREATLASERKALAASDRTRSEIEKANHTLDQIRSNQLLGIVKYIFSFGWLKKNEVAHNVKIEDIGCYSVRKSQDDGPEQWTY